MLTFDVQLGPDEQARLAATNPTDWFTTVQFANAASPPHPQASSLAANHALKRELVGDWVQRLAPGKGSSSAQTSATATPAVATGGSSPAAAPNIGAAATSAPVASPVPTLGPPETRKALAANSTAPASGEPEVRKAKAVTKEELAQAREGGSSPAPESGDQNRVAIQPLKRTYVRVTLGDDGKAAFERWVSPSDGPVEFRGKHVSIRVLDPEAIKITKNGQELQQNDQDVTVN